MQNWFRNPWFQSAGVLVLTAAVSISWNIFWLTPKARAYENLMQQIQLKDAQTSEVISRMPELLKLKRNLKKEEDRLAPIRLQVKKLEEQMFSRTSLASLAQGPGTTLQEEESSELVFSHYSPAVYTLTQQGNYQDLLASLSRFESSSPFLRVLSLTLEKAGEQVLLHADFGTLLNVQKDKQLFQPGPAGRLPSVSRNPFQPLPQETLLRSR